MYDSPCDLVAKCSQIRATVDLIFAHKCSTNVPVQFAWENKHVEGEALRRCIETSYIAVYNSLLFRSSMTVHVATYSGQRGPPWMKPGPWTTSFSVTVFDFGIDEQSDKFLCTLFVIYLISLLLCIHLVYKRQSMTNASNFDRSNAKLRERKWKAKKLKCVDDTLTIFL